MNVRQHLDKAEELLHHTWCLGNANPSRSMITTMQTNVEGIQKEMNEVRLALGLEPRYDWPFNKGVPVNEEMRPGPGRDNECCRCGRWVSDADYSSCHCECLDCHENAD